MTKLEDLKPGLQVTGILPQQSITIVDIQWHGRSAVEITYKRSDGQPGNQLLFRADEERLNITQVQQSWTFAAAGKTIMAGLLVKELIARVVVLQYIPTTSKNHRHQNQSQHRVVGQLAPGRVLALSRSRLNHRCKRRHATTAGCKSIRSA